MYGKVKSVAGFQRKHAKYLMRGRFVDGEGFAIGGRAACPQDAVRRVGDNAPCQIVAKRFLADDGTSAVCIWNISEKSADIAIVGLGEPQGIFAPDGGDVAGPLAPDSIRLYVFGKDK